MLTFECTVPSLAHNPLYEDFDIVEVSSYEPSSEDLILWADGTWAYREDMDDMAHMSDDYQIIFFESPIYDEYHGSI